MPQATQMGPDPAGRKQDGRFAKGRSGNPVGRPRGSRNVVTLACETLLDGQAQALTQKAIDQALAGDMVALRLCLERIFPPRKDRPVTFPLASINSARDAVNLFATVTAAVAAGHVTPVEAAEISKVIDGYLKAFEAAERVDRVECISQLTDSELLRIAMGGAVGDNALVVAGFCRK
ncbi:DUF5681 domain-containing protein [Bradyrhizobium sp. UFLA05-153]